VNSKKKGKLQKKGREFKEKRKVAEERVRDCRRRRRGKGLRLGFR